MTQDQNIENHLLIYAVNKFYEAAKKDGRATDEEAEREIKIAQVLLRPNTKILNDYHQAVKEMMIAKARVMPNYEINELNSQWPSTKDEREEIQNLRTLHKEGSKEREKLEAGIKEMNAASTKMAAIKEKTQKALQGSANKLLTDPSQRSVANYVMQAVADDAAVQAKKDFDREMRSQQQGDEGKQGNVNLSDHIKGLAQSAMKRTGGGSTVPHDPVVRGTNEKGIA